MEELCERVGSGVERSVALKALLTWVELGVLKEEGNRFHLLETAEESARPTASTSRSAAMMEDDSPIMSVQQQQAAQMQVYWKVNLLDHYTRKTTEDERCSSSKACLQILGSSRWNAFRVCSSLHRDTIAHPTNWQRSWKRLSEKD